MRPKYCRIYSLVVGMAFVFQLCVWAFDLFGTLAREEGKGKNGQQLALLSWTSFWTLSHVNGTSSLSTSPSQNRQQGFLFSDGMHGHALAHDFIGILSILNTSLVSITVILLADNAYAWVHPCLCPPPSEATEKIQTTHADGHVPFQEQWCSLFLVEDNALLGSILSLHEPQWSHELGVGVRCFSTEEGKRPQSRCLISGDRI